MPSPFQQGTLHSIPIPLSPFEVLLYNGCMICVAIYLLMDKLGDLVIDNSLTLTVSYQVDQHLLAKNFTTILNALKELQASQQKTESQLKDLSSLKEKYDQLGAKVEKLEKNSNNKESSSNNNQNGGQGDHSGSNQNLAKRVQKSENNIMDNIKDINLINKDLGDVKKLVEDLKNQLAHLGSGDMNKHDRTGYGVEDVASNLSKELHLSAEKMKELEVKLLKAEEQISKHDKDIKDLLENKDRNAGGQAQPSSGGKIDKELEDLKRDLREKLDIINKKINNLQSDTDNHEQEIAQIKEIIAQQEDNKPQEEVDPSSNNKDATNVSKSDLTDLRRRLEQVDKRQVKDIKNLLEQLNNLKKQLQQSQQPQKIDTKSSIEEDNSKSNRKSAIQRDQLNEKLNDLILRVNYLEKLLSGSKSNITQDKNPEKLPALTRPRKGNMTVYQEKDKSGISRKDISELKAELQAWIRSLFEQNKDRENLEDIELKLQEIKKSLQKKADAEGTKKGFTFLENKITQLYLFLTEPETEDAMIVRKGFNCLSCSKRVEKLRGRIGPKLNWNNMTSTNYSPPRVGYSKPMGEHTGDKEEDL